MPQEVWNSLKLVQRGTPMIVPDVLHFPYLIGECKLFGPQFMMVFPRPHEFLQLVPRSDSDEASDGKISVVISH